MQSNFILKILAASAIIALTGGMVAANAAPAPETPSPGARQALSQLNDQQAMEFIETVTNGRLTDKDRAAMPEVLRRFRSGNLRQAPGDNFIDSLINIVGPYFYKVLPLYMNLVFNRTLPDMADTGTMKVDTIYAAPVDEIFYGIGDQRNHYEPYGLSDATIDQGLNAGGRVKHNQSYLWGMTVADNKVYWCTNTNYLCVGGSAGLGAASRPGSDISKGYMNNSWVCECESGIYGQTVHGAIKPEYAQYSDTRIPRIYCYDITTGSVQDITPSGGDYDKLLQDCQGLRSAGYHNGVAFFGGPSLYGSTSGQTVGSSFFAYDTDAGKFIGCKALTDIDGNAITDIRRWYVHNGVLYCGVRITDANGKDRGAVLRWYGDKTNPWQFKIVGWMANEAAELCVYNGYMYVGGWNTASLAVSTVVKGPKVPDNGLQPVDINATEWPIIWKYSDYDAHAIALRTTYTAGMQVWKNHLYWGTFNAVYVIPNIAAANGYTDMTSPEALCFYLGSVRQTSFWRLNTRDKVELLYGETELPVWNKPTTGKDTWTMKSTGWTPKFGRAGFGQPWTAYTWTMAEYGGDLFIGTMNAETLLKAVSVNPDSTQSQFAILQRLTGRKTGHEGFELLRMQDPETAPQYITTDGFGNGTAYGIRNLAVLDKRLFIGSASPLNLERHGGWHLFRLDDKKYSGIETPETPALGVFWRSNGGSFTFASATGENLNTISLTDLQGRTFKTVGIAQPSVTVNAGDIPSNIFIATVTTASGRWTFKIKR